MKIKKAWSYTSTPLHATSVCRGNLHLSLTCRPCRSVRIARDDSISANSSCAKMSYIMYFCIYPMSLLFYIHILQLSVTCKFLPFMVKMTNIVPFIVSVEREVLCFISQYCVMITDVTAPPYPTSCLPCHSSFCVLLIPN